MLEIKNVSKKFKSNIIFENINLKFKKGDLVHLFGINGSGKSTLFKMICNIMDPDKGEIIIDSDTKVGAVIENAGFVENENLLFNLKYLYSLLNTYDEAAEEKIKKLCDEFNLDLYSRKKLKNYSVGMRQKVAIIQAIMENQDILLFDEPTRGLDVDGVEEFFRIIKNISKQNNKIIIIASHDLMNRLDYNRQLIIENYKINEK